jgi:putative DNA primase/helicase
MPDDYYPADMGDALDIPEDDYPEPIFFSGVKHPSGRDAPFGNRNITQEKELIWPSLRLSDAVLKTLNWLWRGFLPVGKVVCLYGVGGVGKTTVVLDLVARLTTGVVFPDGTPNGKTGSAVIITGEDGISDTIKPRLLAAGGDPEKVFVLDSVFTLNGKTHVLNLADMDSTDCLEEKLREFPDLILLVIDPITGVMSGVDSHRIGDVRGCLAPLIRIADNLGITIVFIHHCNKNVTQSAASRASGSTAFIDAVRAAIMCCQNPDDPQNRRVLSVTKSNLAEIPPGIGYTLCATSGDDVAHVEWEPSRITLSADELLSAGLDDDSAVSAEDFLRELLSDGAMPARDVQTAARDNGFSPKCIRRAFEKLGGKPRKGEFKGGWVWELPVEPKIPQYDQDAQS